MQFSYIKYANILDCTCSQIYVMQKLVIMKSMREVTVAIQDVVLIL